jgi:AbrB family looped-hinge helix DNA binding protein
MATMRVKVSEAGRLSLPVEVRRQLGIERGGTVVLKVEDGEVRMTTLQETVRRIQERMRKLTQGKNISVDDFLAWKREQAALESGEPVDPEAAGR